MAQEAAPERTHVLLARRLPLKGKRNNRNNVGQWS